MSSQKRTSYQGGRWSEQNPGKYSRMYSFSKMDELRYPSGIFAVNKPIGWTSNDVVKKISGALRFYFGRKIRLGHGGSLDPLATGVIVLGVGMATKELTRLTVESKKEYIFTGEFGKETNTQDADPLGTVIKTAPFDHITREKLDGVLTQFRGNIMQIPPQFSAKKVNGRVSYKAARKGKVLDHKPKAIEVDLLECVDFNLPNFTLRARVSAGTYVRTLVNDIGLSLNSCAFAVNITRVRVDNFTLEDCLNKEDWSGDKILDKLYKSPKRQRSSKPVS